MKVKFIKYLFLVLILLVLSGFFLIDQIGGNFKGDPDQMEANISQGAKDLISRIYGDIDASKLVDHHVHVVGLDKEKGTYINPRMFSWAHPFDRIKTSVYMSGAKVDDLENSNQQYLDRLVSLLKNNNHGKFHILALDKYYNKDGSVNDEKTEFYVSNQYIMDVVAKYPDLFVPVISVHPYRKDALLELEKYAKMGARWIKWLPNAQGMNPADPDIAPYYAIMKKYNMVLLSHAGYERAVHAAEDQELGNPLLLRYPLENGVKVAVAHCASLGKSKDLDNDNAEIDSIDLFFRMMDNKKYEGLLFGEISATTQFNRVPGALQKLLARDDLHHRMISGSDYPLPALNMIVHTKSLVKHGFITEQEREYLNEIYNYNPMVFDYAVKRLVKNPKTGKGFDKSIFVRNISD